MSKVILVKFVLERGGVISASRQARNKIPTQMFSGSNILMMLSVILPDKAESEIQDGG